MIIISDRHFFQFLIEARHLIAIILIQFKYYCPKKLFPKIHERKIIIESFGFKDKALSSH